jgi:hypothetical protein
MSTLSEKQKYLADKADEIRAHLGGSAVGIVVVADLNGNTIPDATVATSIPILEVPTVTADAPVEPAIAALKGMAGLLGPGPAKLVGGALDSLIPPRTVG